MQTEILSTPTRLRPTPPTPKDMRRPPLRVGDCMSATVHTLPAASTLRDAALRLAHLGIGCVVVTQGSRAEGIVTERDIVRIASIEPSAWATMSVGSVMTRPLWTIQPEARIELAIAAL